MVDVGKIIEYENGEMDNGEVIHFFAELIKDGTAWQLQGSYGRAAASFIQNGLITRSGKITSKGLELVEGDN